MKAWAVYFRFDNKLQRYPFDTLDNALLASARLRQCGYSPKIVHSPNSEYIQLNKGII